MNNLINEIQNLNETQLTKLTNFLQTVKTDKSLLQQNLEILESPPKNLPPEFYKTEFFQQHKLFKTIFFLTKLNYHYSQVAHFFGTNVTEIEDPEELLTEYLYNINTEIYNLETVLETNHTNQLTVEPEVYEELEHIYTNNNTISPKSVSIFLVLTLLRLKHLFDNTTLNSISTNVPRPGQFQITTETNNGITITDFNKRRNTFSEDIVDLILKEIILQIDLTIQNLIYPLIQFE